MIFILANPPIIMMEEAVANLSYGINFELKLSTNKK